MAEKKIINNQKRNFADNWLKDPDFTGWLVKVKEDMTKTRCLVCHKTIELSTSGRSAMDNILSETNLTNWEIIWILKCVMSSVSVPFNNDIRETFIAMFPDITFKDFSLNRTKSMYVINHGLASYFQTLLIHALGKSEIHVYSFDGSLNDSTQTSEIDLCYILRQSW